MYGGQYTIVPSLSLKESYDDNIYLYWRGEKGDFVTYFQPKIVTNLNTERTKIGATAQVNFLRYMDETNLNTEEYTYILGLNHQKSERLLFNLRGKYTRDTTLESEWTETGVGLERNIRKNYAGNFSITYNLKERHSIGFSSFYTKSNYESRAYVDYSYSGASLDYTYNLANNRLYFDVLFGYHYFKSDIGRTHNILNFWGINYLFSDTTKINGFLGLRYSDSEAKLKRYIIFDYYLIYSGKVEKRTALLPYTEIKREKNWGFLLNLNLTRQIENGSFSAGIERNITPSVIGEIILRQKIFTRFTYKFSERWKASLFANYYQGKTTGSVRTLNYYSYDVRPSIKFFLTENTSLELSYLRQFYKSKLTDFKAERNVFFLGINWSKIYLW